MKNRNSYILMLFVFLFSPLPFFPQADKMDWWHDARFGMFIHWGVYSVYGNVYKGIDINGDSIDYDMRTSGIPSEWIMYTCKIPRDIYREAAKEFDAKDYDPEKWVEIAKNAGMKYIIITAKHHDGFCLFETQYTDWNVIDASGAKRDLLKDLVKEAKEAGLKIGFYYSQNLDWMHEGGMGNIPELNGEMYPVGQVKVYVNTVVIPHIQELTSKYDIDVFWFDGGGVANSNAQISQQILDALLNSPVGNKIIYNDRLFTDFEGDFRTPETDTPYIPYNGYPDNRAWEACASLSNSWGFEYEPAEETIWNKDRWKTGYYIVSRILEIASKGGNFLLNIGPDRHGNIPEPAVKTLQDVGEWMKIYGETVYGTGKNSLIHPFEYGYVTQKTENDGSVHWYLHVSPSCWEEKEILLNGIAGFPESATLFDSKEPLQFQVKNNCLILILPDEYSNSYYTTIDLHFRKPPLQMDRYSLQNNKIRLTPYQATTHSVYKNFSPYTFCSWFYTYSLIEFTVFLEAGEYDLDADYAAWYQGGELYFIIDDQKTYTATYENTGNPSVANDINNYISTNLIKGINIPVSKFYSIKIHRNAQLPNVTNWINVRSFTLIKTSQNGIRKTEYPTIIKNGYIICESPVEQTVNIYDAVGRLRKTCTVGMNKIVNVRTFEPGVYVIKGDRFTQKIILQ